ncbi:hypothetical protein FisN_4Hh477 [Fistulifera solaris]|uniref:Uncharacterized protein n=1 Tax=Fistulifera solaris TaxID=1519565 RepID=A0A1Z5KIG3_FISSO|nr:hypothetical protein FisN_4Hh477 [Fistulifera solaris]|eukprot:GAX26026.1 hypothetical protein FisN_4Hh477 [Fistulifera solaris]
MTDNPFAFGGSAQSQAPMAGNPFGATGGGNTAPPQQQQQQQPSNPFGVSAYGQPDNQSVAGQSYSAYSYESSQQFAAPPPQQQQPPAPANYNPYGHNPFGQQTSPYAPPEQGPAPSAYAPYAAAPPQPPIDNALVVSQYQGNPYAQQPPAYDNALVVSQTQSNPYGAYAPSQPQPGGNPFDPFATAPPPAPTPASYTPQAVPPPQPGAYGQHYAPPPQTAPPADDLDFFGNAPQPAPAPAPTADVASLPRYQPKSEAPPSVRADEHPAYRNVENVSANDEIPAGSPRNKFSTELAREAPMGASPLPKAELVQKRGYVLARISFRTIVIKKWKQVFWIRYGPHTMLFFRSEADFDDWLNNPYHDQTQRNFLIKLAVNFVHDLYKPNVRGYQVTQCRTKAYGNKMVRQFKLERWMDYGPTIAAAFGSYNPKEVDDLREALVECMRNTPLSGGIRATGAVRRPPTQEEKDRDGGSDYGREGGRSARDDEIHAQETKDDEPGEEADLLDVNNWDDVPSQSAVPQYDQAPYAAAYGAQAPVAANAGYGQVPQQTYPMPGQPYQNAMIPAGAPQAYPGAPSMPYQQPPATQSMVPYQQEQSYPPAQAYQQSAQPQGYNPYQPQPPQDPWATQPQQAPPAQPTQYQMGY